MFDWYKNIAHYYKDGFYTDEQLADFVTAKRITQAQADEIKASKETV